jgi:predicted secreted protein
MATVATLGRGTILSLAATPIEECLTITGPSLKRDTPDVTNMDSANSVREFIAGLFDGGEVTVTANWLPAAAGQVALRNAMDAGTPGSWTLQWTDSGTTTATFTAICTAFEPSSPHDGPMRLSFTLKCTMKPTYA